MFFLINSLICSTFYVYYSLNQLHLTLLVVYIGYSAHVVIISYIIFCRCVLFHIEHMLMLIRLLKTSGLARTQVSYTDPELLSVCVALIFISRFFNEF